MGSVWLAEHLSLHSPVAIKLIAKEVADTEDGLQRFLREARMAASLRSPHVVQILDYGLQQGVPYIAMELLEGESLAQRLARVRRLSLSQTELVLRHVGRAVGRAHDLGIVHRDLKPGNIFIVRNEDEEVVKLLDFGIAKSTLDTPSPSVASRTRTGAFLGTPYYVSPEQARGSKTVDHRTDIWAIGVVAFECVLGQPPFIADTFGSLVFAICSQPMPVPSQLGPVPAGFDAWFARACAREPEARFPTAREAIAELRRVLAPRAVELAAARTRTSLPASPGAVLAAPRGGQPEAQAQAHVEPHSPWTVPDLGVTAGAASSSGGARQRPAGLNANVARFAGGAVLVAVGTALWIAWRSGPSENAAPFDSSAEAALPEAPPGTSPVSISKPSVGTPEVNPSGLSPSGPSPPSGAVSPVVSASGPRVVPVAELAPNGAPRGAPTAAAQPRRAKKPAAVTATRGSKTSSPRAPKVARPASAQADIALTPGPPAGAPPKSEPAPAKHNLGF